MTRKLMPTMVLAAAMMVGGTTAVHAAVATAARQEQVASVPGQNSAAALEQYNRRLADYRKDLAAYEADPTIWTTEIPQPPAMPAAPEAQTRQQQSTRKGEQP